MVSPGLIDRVDAVVIGASAGAVDALNVVLPKLTSTRLPFLVVVHLPPTRPSMLVEIFGPRCKLPVRAPVDKEPITPGIWLAPPDYHLLVESDRTFAMSLDEPVNFSRPSIDVLFESAADVYGSRLLAVVMTGASHDGARGAKKVRDVGGTVVVQDPKTAEVDVMPRAAIQASGTTLILPIAEIAQGLGQA